ncbi:hypothetical protein BDN72DRAFT_821344 [Pluteus cervinus]|uniref:Uncharacterized protein n=1 Tax=Pluteus cervinus TaxID=181527 RepID=A0ACD3ARY3_9AGAR|nr:hypothetical protein BDN72DRAFT_821344 [Pluteus cervinus]
MSTIASNQQLAIARPHRGDGRQVPKAARQAVPAFLQKLYEMVNDQKNSDLIRWSEAGDSFYVLDHERFAREVLGRWFKHQNFSSFVRQLNMYGFHKIPHLQQGVLKSENETEFWNFAHSNFHQDQPDLLCLIQRKKQAPQANDDIPTIDVRESGSTSQNPAATLPSGQVLDVHSILNGLTALKRHQTTLSSELNDLKRSNQLLWQEAMAAREKHQKQQDTINRIVKFLAGIFGQNAQHKEDAVEAQPSRAVIPRRQPRLVIEDRPRQSSGKVEITEVVDEESDQDSPFYQVPETISPQVPIIETPSAPSPTPSIASETPSVADIHTYPLVNDPNLNKSVSNAIRHKSTPSGSQLQPGTQNQPPSQPPTPPSQSQQPSAAASTNEIPTSSPAEERTMTRSPAIGGAFDPNYSNSLQSLLSQMTPAQMQQLLSSLAIGMPSDSLNPSTQIAPYQPPFDYNQYASSPSSFSLLSPQQPQQPQQIQDPNERHWKGTEDIDRDVNALTTSIDHLMQTFGLDPQLMNDSSNSGDGSGTSAISTSGITEDTNLVIDPSALDLAYANPPPGRLANVLDSGKEFDFDSLLHGFSSDAGSGTEDLGGSGDVGYSSNFDADMLGMTPSTTGTSTSTTQFLSDGCSPAVSQSASPLVDPTRPTSIAPSQMKLGGMLPPTSLTGSTPSLSPSSTSTTKKRKSDVMDLLPTAPTAASLALPQLQIHADAAANTSVSPSSLGGMSVPLEIRNFTPPTAMSSMFNVLGGGSPMTGILGGPGAAVTQAPASGVAASTTSMAGNANKKRRRSK